MKNTLRTLFVVFALAFAGLGRLQALSIRWPMAPAAKFENQPLVECLEELVIRGEKDMGNEGVSFVCFVPKAIAERRVTAELPTGRLEASLRALAEQAGCEVRSEQYAYFVAEKGAPLFPPILVEKGAEKLEKALRKLIPPHLEFRESTLREAVGFLTAKAVQLAAREKVDLPNRPEGFITVPAESAEPRIIFHSNGMPVVDVCRYLAGLAGLQVTVGPRGVDFAPPAKASGLISPSQAERDSAAKDLRANHKPSPSTKWDTRLAALKAGDARENVQRLLAELEATPEGGAGGGGSFTEHFRLDTEWVVACTFTRNWPQPGQSLSAHNLTRSLQRFWVAPPPDFTGVWTTYFANGQRSHEIHYEKGKYAGVFTFFHPDGSKACVQHYGPDGAEGEDTGYFPSGKMMYRGQHKAGRQVGTWTHYDEDGSVRSKTEHPAP